MKITKITANEGLDGMTNKEYLYQCLDDEVVDAQVLCRELLHFISESDAEEIVTTLELDYHQEYDEY